MSGMNILTPHNAMHCIISAHPFFALQKSRFWVMCHLRYTGQRSRSQHGVFLLCDIHIASLRCEHTEHSLYASSTLFLEQDPG